MAKNKDEKYAKKLDEMAQRHLWMHFSRMGTYSKKKAIPIIARGEGSYGWDIHGKQYLDGLSGLFTAQLGHGRADLADAAAAQAKTLEYWPIWTYAHPTAIELAAKLAELAPGNLNRVFFTSGGSEAVESALKLARQYHRMRGDGQRYKIIARKLSYHGTTMGALTVTGLSAYKNVFEPLVPGSHHVGNTNRYRHPLGDDEKAFMLSITDEIEEAIIWEGPENVAAVFLEPVQNAGGCFTPPEGYFQRVREICDKYGVLFISDEVICAFGRLGTWFGAERFDYLPDMITCAKGITSGYAPLGAVICGDHIAEPFLEGNNSFLHGLTFAGHPVSCAVALTNLAAMENEDILGHVQRNEAGFRERLESLRDIPIVGDVRGRGYFYGIELVRDQQTKETFTDAEAEDLLRGFLSPALYDAGLICRSDDRGDPVVQLAPPLICGDKELDFIEATMRTVLTEAWRRFGLAGAAA